ncbi:MAG: CDP-alcohol phosphatidyltransferase family protein [Bacteroidota bacterium]
MRHLPNILTCINLLCGCMAIITLTDDPFINVGLPYQAYLFFFIALLMDLLDGLVARSLNAYSDLGKQLDSLADMVSFGVFPGFLWLKLFSLSRWSLEGSVFIAEYLFPILAFLFTVAVALRLAKFNIDERQTTDFLGIPSPAAAIFTLGFFHWVTHYPKNIFYINPSSTITRDLDFEKYFSEYHVVFQQPWLLLIVLLFISTMMLVEIPMFSLKVKKWQWQGNEIKIIFLLLSGILLLIWQLMALPLIIVLFILISVIRYYFKPKNG